MQHAALSSPETKSEKMVSKPRSALKSSSAVKPPHSTTSLIGQEIRDQRSSHHTVRAISPCILPKLLTKPLVCKLCPWRLSGVLSTGAADKPQLSSFCPAAPNTSPLAHTGAAPDFMCKLMKHRNTAQQRHKTPTSCFTDNKIEAMKRRNLLIVPFLTPPVASNQG